LTSTVPLVVSSLFLSRVANSGLRGAAAIRRYLRLDRLYLSTKGEEARKSAIGGIIVAFFFRVQKVKKKSV
jgi:hypothetical protein